MIELGDPEEAVTIEPRAEAPDASPWPLTDELLAALDDVDIVADIEADQDELIRTPSEALLVIEGGPGTGKTLTALQRVSWLIDECGVDAGKVLVVGPSAAFARYTRDVLNSWGHDAVEHRAIDGLLHSADAGRDESPYATRLKGEARMARLLSRALEVRKTGLPGDLPSEVHVQGRAVPIDPIMLRTVIATARASEATPGDRRRLLRATLAAVSADPRLVLAAADRLADMLWPSFEPAGFLRDLLASPEWLTAAAADEFTEREVSALHRPAPQDLVDDVWSDADLPLLDEAEHLLSGGPPGYAHVVVCQAQDLSPMQARAVARRSANGSMTIVGDMAQSTGSWARDDWHDLLAQLPSLMPHVHRELRYGYRVPRQIFDLAAELLPTAAPSVQAPTTVRDGPAEPAIVPIEPADRAGAVVAAAMEHVAAARTVGIICSPRCQGEIIEWLDEEDLPWRRPSADEAGPGIVLLTPHEAKGLEFEAAIVVEPGFIVDEDPRGHRLLYVALTRATGYMHLIGAPEDLPADFVTPVSVPVPSSAPPAASVPVQVSAPVSAAPASMPDGVDAERPVSGAATAGAVEGLDAGARGSDTAQAEAPGSGARGSDTAGSGTFDSDMRDSGRAEPAASALGAPAWAAPTSLMPTIGRPVAETRASGTHAAAPSSTAPASGVPDLDGADPEALRSAVPVSSPAQPQAPASGVRESGSFDLEAPVAAALPTPEPEVPLDPATREAINLVAHTVAETLLANLTPELWPIALERVIELITPDN